MTHPLTDEIIDEINEKNNIAVERSYDEDMRAAYDLAVEHITEQWEEVINSPRTDIRMIREFDKRLKAMRPQKDTP